MSNVASLVRRGMFAEAEEAFRPDPQAGFESILTAAYEDGSALFYAFLARLIALDETAEHHYMASQLMSTALCHLPGGYATALYHSRQALALAPENVDIKKDMLLFYDIPEQLLSQEEAIRLSEEILGADPNHTIARATESGVNPELLTRLNRDHRNRDA